MNGNQATVTCTGEAATKLLNSLTTFLQRNDHEGYLAGASGTSSSFASLNNSAENTYTLLGQVGITNVNCFTGFWHDTCKIDYVQNSN